MAQHAVGGLGQVDADQVELAGCAGQALDVAQHARRLAQNDVDGHVHRAHFGGRLGLDRIQARQAFAVDHAQLALFGGHADHGIGAALAPRDGVEAVQVLRQDREHIALLRFVAPDLGGRHAGLFDRHALEVEHRAARRVVDQFGESIGQSARAHVVDGDDGVAAAQLPAAVDDFLRAALDLGVAALHGIEVQVGRIAAHAHAGRGAAAHADAQARTAQLDEQRARRDRVFMSQARIDAAQAAGDHDGLVIAPAHHVVTPPRGLLIRAEIAQQIGPAEFVVEGRAAQGAVDHDRQRRGDALGQAVVIGFPGLPGRVRKTRQAQMRHGKAGEAGLGLGAAAGGPLVADLAAGAGGSAGERRDGGRVIMRLDLHQRVHGGLAAAIHRARAGQAGNARLEALRRAAFHDRGVVGIGHHGTVGLRLVRGADHAKERARLLGAVDLPLRVEDLVAAVFAVGLREHHQLDVGRVALEHGEGFGQIVDFVFGQGQAQRDVGLDQRGAALGQHRHGAHRLAGQRREQRLAVEAGVDHGFGHAVVQAGGRPGQGAFVEGLAAEQATLGRERVADAALDAAHRRQAAIAGDVGGLAGPGRHGAQARDDQQFQYLGRGGFGIGRIAVIEQFGQAPCVLRAEFGVGQDKVFVAGRDIGDRQAGLFQQGKQTFAAEGGEDRGTGQMLDEGHDAAEVGEIKSGFYLFAFPLRRCNRPAARRNQAGWTS